MPQFIALDGEGLSRGDLHDYVLFAASNDTFIERLDDGGLSTLECFEYLIATASENPDAVLVGFFHSYDCNMIFRDIPPHVLARLWVKNDATWRPDFDFKHPYTYRIKYVPNRFIEILRGWWYIDENNGRYRWHAEGKCVWWDVFQFFQMSFVKSLKDWNVTTAENIADITAMKDARGIFTAEQMESIRNYCFDECRLLVKLMDKLSDSLDAAGIHLTSWYGSGAIAAALLRSHRINREVVHDDFETPLGQATLGAYFGGRVETFAVGVNELPTHYYDIRSAYPAAMTSLPALRGGTWEHVDRYDAGAEFALWRVQWQCTRGSRLTPFPFRHQKRIFWSSTGEGWYHAIEVTAASRAAWKMGWRLSILEGFVLHSTGEAPFREWVTELYEQRAANKAAGNPAEKPQKLGLNSLYGKMAQSQASRPNMVPPFRSYYWAGYITAQCRAMILAAASTASMNEHNLLSIATDGIFARAPIEGLTIGAELGQWEHDILEPGLVLLQPGVYATPSRTIIRTRGFSAGGLTYDDIVGKWRAERFDAKLEVPDTRFIGFGQALARNRLGGERNIWRTWQRGQKTIKMAGTASKHPDMSSDMNADLIWLRPSPAPVDEISAPYAPRVKNVETLRLLEIDSGALAEQPDAYENDFSYRAV